MNRADVLVRRATVDDVDAIVALQRQGLGEGTLPRTPEAWRWKHIENPFGASFVLVAEAAGALVGLRAFMRWSFVDVDGAVVDSVRAVDTVTRPDWQGRGLFTQLTTQLCREVTDAGISFVFNTPNEKSRPGYLKMGWEDLGRMMVWVTPVRPVGILGRNGPQAAPRAADSLRDIDIAAASPRGFHTPLSPNFLRWRYGAAPGIDYRAIVDDRAVVVGRRRTRTLWGVSLPEAMICEVIVGEGVRGVLHAAQSVRRLANDLDAAYAIAVAPVGSRQAAALVAGGFVPAPRAGPHFTVRPLQSTGPARRALSPSSWRLGLGDVELF